MRDFLVIVCLSLFVIFLVLLVFTSLKYIQLVNGLHSTLINLQDRLSDIDDSSLCHLPDLYPDIRRLENDVVGIFNRRGSR